VGFFLLVKFGTKIEAPNLNVASPVLLTDKIVIGASNIFGGL
jgi:hypothetical protein